MVKSSPYPTLLSADSEKETDFEMHIVQACAYRTMKTNPTVGKVISSDITSFRLSLKSSSDELSLELLYFFHL